MTQPPNFSIHEAAQWLGVSARTVYRLSQSGRLPGFKVGNQWRFSQELLERWAADQVTMGWLKRGVSARSLRRPTAGEEPT
ncbi:MAG: helix-turn-helix domain-containing protein [Candidatus Omnitrophica bacterium]|nr:helix-turn-helix domain-containing protein [Candidatus Omnitrophota bacterium]